MEKAVQGFAQRVGVMPKDVVAVMLGLAENESRERYGAVEMAQLLARCRPLLEGKPVRDRRRLSTEVDACLRRFTAQ